MSGEKRVTLRLVRTDGNDDEIVREGVDTVREGHSVQYAVMEFYALPGASHAVSLSRGGAWVGLLWWNGRSGERCWGRDWYSRIQDGDVVTIYIWFDDMQHPPDGPGWTSTSRSRTDEDQEAPTGPGGRAAGGHGGGPEGLGAGLGGCCGCVRCTLDELARVAQG